MFWQALSHHFFEILLTERRFGLGAFDTGDMAEKGHVGQSGSFALNVGNYLNVAIDEADGFDLELTPAFGGPVDGQDAEFKIDVGFGEFQQIAGAEGRIGGQQLNAQPDLGVDVKGDDLDLIDDFALGLEIGDFPVPQFIGNVGKFGHLGDADHIVINQAFEKIMQAGPVVVSGFFRDPLDAVQKQADVFAVERLNVLLPEDGNGPVHVVLDVVDRLDFELLFGPDELFGLGLESQGRVFLIVTGVKGPFHRFEPKSAEELRGFGVGLEVLEHLFKPHIKPRGRNLRMVWAETSLAPLVMHQCRTADKAFLPRIDIPLQHIPPPSVFETDILAYVKEAFNMGYDLPSSCLSSFI